MSAATAAEGNYIENGILYNRLGRVVDPGICRQYGWDCPAGQEAAYTAYVDAVLSDYRKRQANAPVSHEQAAEMRAAFGPGRTVVNVITGRKFRT